MLIGVLLGIAAGALWGLIYIAPLLLPQYNPVLVALGRFIAFGLVSLPFMFFMKEDLKRFTKPDIIPYLQHGIPLHTQNLSPH